MRADESRADEPHPDPRHRLPVTLLTYQPRGVALVIHAVVVE